MKWKFLLASSLVLAAAPALAAPSSVTLTPPDGARFVEQQRVDLRVEGQGVGPFWAMLQIDGRPVAFTSGVQNSNATDGITSAGWGGFNMRGQSFGSGPHKLEATFGDATGQVTVTSHIQVIDLFGKHVRGGPIKNVIIMVGDGMGVGHRTAARIVRNGVTNGDPDGWLAMDMMPGTGLVSTHSFNSIITDSAPGMSGYVSGSHNANSQEGVYPAHMTNSFYGPRVEYLSEYLHRVKGSSLGLVSTADLEDATPAANAVHTLNRNLGQGIVDQYLDEADSRDTGDHGTGLSVLLGGGRRWFLPSAEWGSSRSNANDYDSLPKDLVDGWGLPAAAAGSVDANRDLIADFQKAGFTYVEDAGSLSDAVAAVGKKKNGTSKLLGLFGYGNMNAAVDKVAKRRNQLLPGASTFTVDDYFASEQPMLDEMTDAAIQVLQRDRDGFVLMVEAAHIDKQAHLMDAERSIGEVLEFDRAIGVANDFAKRSGDTLVLVLADHECSGFSLIGALAKGVDNARNLPSDAAVTDPTKVPARQNIVGTYDAAGFPRYKILQDGYPDLWDVDGKLLVGFGASADRYETWLAHPRPVIDSLLPTNVKTSLTGAGYVSSAIKRPEDANGEFLRGQVPGDQAVHTAADIPVSAYSADGDGTWQKFVGVQTNTDIFFKVMRAQFRGGGHEREDNCWER